MSLVKRALENVRREQDDGEVEKAGMAPALQGSPGATGGATYPVWGQSSPFVQTAGNATGANPLPRPWESYGSLFGPGFPLFPDALDPLRRDGRADPRRYQYPVAWNLQLVDRDVPWTTLRKLATEVDLVNRCIELVQDAVVGMKWQWGFSRQIINQIKLEENEKNSGKAVALAREKYGDELATVQKFFERPDERMGYTFSQWLTAFVWAELVYDGVVIYPSYYASGKLHSLSLLDTSTIKILLDNQGFLPQPPAPAYQQILYGFPRGEFQAEEVDAEGKIPKSYRSDQLAYYIRRPRLHTPYGFSTVEECINYATLYMQRHEWMHAEWSHGVTPKGVIKTTGTEGWTPEQFAYYQNAINDQWSGQTQRRQQLLVMRPGMEWEQLKDMAELYTNTFDEWIVCQIGAKFGVPQQQLGIPMMLHTMASGTQTIAQMDLTDKFALDALINFIIDCCNDLARRFLGVGPEITMTATGGNSDAADAQRAQAEVAYVNSGVLTRNEIRMAHGEPLITEPEADELGITSSTGVTFLAGQLASQEAQRAALEAGIPLEGGDRQRSSRLDQRADPAVNPTNIHVRGSGNGTTGSGARQPGAPQRVDTDSGAYVQKELDQFLKFANKRLSKGSSWRDFDFQTLDESAALLLNEIGEDGDWGAVQETAELIKAGVCTGPGPCDTSEIGEGPNWVTRVQGLPHYIRAIAHALLRSGHSEQDAIALAVGTVKRWASGGGKVTEATRARAAAAVKEWEEKRAEAHASHGKSVDTAIIAPSGQLVLPQPLKTGDRVIVEHKNDDEDKYHVKDYDSLNKTTPQNIALAESLHSHLTDKYAPKIAAAMQDCDGIEDAIEAARQALGMYTVTDYSAAV